MYIQEKSVCQFQYKRKCNKRLEVHLIIWRYYRSQTSVSPIPGISILPLFSFSFLFNAVFQCKRNTVHVQNRWTIIEQARCRWKVLLLRLRFNAIKSFRFFRNGLPVCNFIIFKRIPVERFRLCGRWENFSLQMQSSFCWIIK